MKGGRRLGFLLLLPLFLQIPIATIITPVPPTGPAAVPFYLAPGYYEYFPVESYMNNTVVSYSLVSNASVSVAFMTGTQFEDFVGGNGPVSNSIADQNGTGVNQTLRVAPGPYAVLVYAYGGAANLTMELAMFPNNPLGYGQVTAPEPSGIVSFGLANSTGSDYPYAVASTDVVGFASIHSMAAFNSSASSVSVNPSGVTLQLNSMLVVDESGGENQVYWCQNTPDFVTAASQVALSDNVWNASSQGVLTNNSITTQGGAGYVSILQRNGTTQYYYAVEAANSTYALPLGVILLMNATAEPGTGVVVQFGTRLTGGVPGMTRTDWFDNVTIHDPAVTNAYFLTDGNYSTPIGTFYDTELVFGGEGNGEATTFTGMASSLGLYYANGTTALLNAFPSYYSFGQDTQESAYNLKVSYIANGEAQVSVGTPSYDYLGRASGSYSLASVETSLGFPGVNSTSTSVVGTTTTASTSSGTSIGSIPEFPAQTEAVSLFLGLTALAWVLARRRPNRNQGRP